MPALLRASIAALFFAMIFGAAPPGTAAIPAELAAEFERIAAAYPGTEGAISSPSGDDLASMTRRAARQGAESRLAAAAIGAIAERPGETGEIVEAAVRAMPHLEAGVVNRVLAAFPGFRDIVLAGAARAATPPRQAEPPPAQPPPPEPIVAETPDASEPVAAVPPVETSGVGPEEISDPLEGFNRAMFFLNDGIDTLLIRPAAYLYGNLTPPFVKRRVSNFFSNLGEPVVAANDLLQLEFEDAGTALARFAINSTIGLAGLFDVATEFGLPPHESDFGQTLHAYGAGPGPYLVLPLLGPTTLRDGTGFAVDTLMNPFTWLLESEENLALAIGKGLVRREELLAALDALRDSSVDYYAAVRSLYYQNRAVELGRGAAPDNSALDAEFEAFE